MIIQCPACGKIRKFGKWIELPRVLAERMKTENYPVMNETCDNCKTCNRLKLLETKFDTFKLGDKILAIFLIVIVVVLCFSGYSWLTFQSSLDEKIHKTIEQKLYVK